MIVGSDAPVPESCPVIVLLDTLIYHWLPSHWTGCPTSPDCLSETLVRIFNFVPPFTVIGSSASASASDAASLTVVLFGAIA